MTEQRLPRARRGDFITSTQGARNIAKRAPNQRVKLLLQYREDDDRGGDGLTDEEAASAAGLLASCHWKRCGELRADGLIEQPPDEPTRQGSAGVERIICQITKPGRAYLEAMEL
jgi:hypothetical protein